MSFKYNKLNLRQLESQRREIIFELKNDPSELKNILSGISTNNVIARLTNIIAQKEQFISPFLLTDDQTLNPGLFINNIIPKITTDFQIFNLRLAKVAFVNPGLTLTLTDFPQTSISVVSIINQVGGVQTIELQDTYQLFFPGQSNSNIPGVTSIIFTNSSRPGDNVTLTYINRQNLLLEPGIRIRTNTPYIQYI